MNPMVCVVSRVCQKIFLLNHQRKSHCSSPRWVLLLPIIIRIKNMTFGRIKRSILLACGSIWGGLESVCFFPIRFYSLFMVLLIPMSCDERGPLYTYLYLKCRTGWCYKLIPENWSLWLTRFNKFSAHPKPILFYHYFCYYCNMMTARTLGLGNR